MSITEEEGAKTIHTTTTDPVAVATPRPPPPPPPTEKQQQQQQQQTEKKQESLQVKLENWKSFFFKIYDQLHLYFDATKSIFQTFWQYPEFRLGVYIFGLLSIIPVSIFLLFITIVISSTTLLLSCVWTFFVFSAITIGLIILIPILFVSSIIAAIIIVGYYTYQFTLQFTQQQTIDNKH